jgi:hypothetical protein
MLNRGTELLQFIEQKRQTELDVHLEDIYSVYLDIIISSLNKSYDKLNHISFAISCTETTHLLFWIVLKYAKNVKLTTFLCDRAIVLFNEYIKMSKSTLLGNDINLGEIKHFVYKKTIGPLSIVDIGTENICRPDFETLTEATLSLFLFWFRKVGESYLVSDESINEVEQVKNKLKWLQQFCKKVIWPRYQTSQSSKIADTIQKLLEKDDLIYEKNIDTIQNILNLKIIEE